MKSKIDVFAVDEWLQEHHQIRIEEWALRHLLELKETEDKE